MYYNNSDRKYANAYEETLREQEILSKKLICEEMGRTTKENLEKVSNVLIKLQMSMEKYYDELRSNYDFDEQDEVVKVPKTSLNFLKNLYDKLLGGKE